MTGRSVLRVGIVGLGAVGRVVAEAIDSGVDGYVLSALSARRLDVAREFSESLRNPVPVVAAADVVERSDVIIECAPASIFRDIAEPTVAAGKTLVVLSAGALLTSWDLVEAARDTGASILVPSGALLGLDAVQGAAEGAIDSVRMVTRKPVKGLLGAPYLVENQVSIEDVQEPTMVFSGTAREAAVGFPANLNVVVALSLAGVGPDRTVLEIWADPSLTRNTHSVEVISDAAVFSMSIANVPSENPKTGRLTALSVIALLRKRTSALQVGT
jgi:aspartate dehydrogenase